MKKLVGKAGNFTVVKDILNVILSVGINLLQRNVPNAVVICWKSITEKGRPSIYAQMKTVIINLS